MTNPPDLIPTKFSGHTVYINTAKCKEKSDEGGVYKEERKSNQRGYKFRPCDPWIKKENIHQASLLSVSIRCYGQNITIHNLYGSLWGPYKACGQNGISDS